MSGYTNADRIEFAHMEVGEKLDLITINRVVFDEASGEPSVTYVLHRWHPQTPRLGGEPQIPVFETACGLPVMGENALPMTHRLLELKCSTCEVTDEELAQTNAILETWQTKED